jgi:hypothetical protein
MWKRQSLKEISFFILNKNREKNLILVCEKCEKIENRLRKSK